MSGKPGPKGNARGNVNLSHMGHKIVCLTCRKAFSNNLGYLHAFGRCQECGGEYLYFNHKFRPPKRNDIKAWRVVKFLRENGFVYHHIKEYVPTTHSGYIVDTAYPTNMKDAVLFVNRYKDQVVKFIPSA
jgi:hypothetical protein